MGRLQNESYENKEGDTIRYDQLILREIHFADGKMNEEGRQESSSKTSGENKSAGSRNGSRENSSRGQQGKNAGGERKSGRQQSGYQNKGRKQDADDTFMDDGVDEELPFN